VKKAINQQCTLLQSLTGVAQESPIPAQSVRAIWPGPVNRCENSFCFRKEKVRCREPRCVCVALFYPILGHRYSLFQKPHTTWGGQNFTLHLNFVAGYTGPLLFLFERTHSYPVDDQGVLPWCLRCLCESKVRLASLVKVLNDGKIFWVLWP